VYLEGGPAFLLLCAGVGSCVCSISLPNRCSKDSWKEQSQTDDVVIKSEGSFGRGWDTACQELASRSPVYGNHETNLAKGTHQGNSSRLKLRVIVGGCVFVSTVARFRIAVQHT
jgi:hypothetical protein